MKNINRKKILYLFLLLQPIIDVFTSLMVKFTDTFLTIGMIIRGIFLFLMLLYIFFFNSSKYKNKSIIYLSILFIFILLYFITKPDIFTLDYLLIEVKYLFRYMYFPIITIALINFYDQEKLEKEQLFKIFIFDLLLYSFLIVFPEITGTSFLSYHYGKGTVGWFYAANEIGAILVALFPFLYYLLFERVNIINTFILFILVIIAMNLLGTKTAFLGMLLIELLYLVYFIINYKNNRGFGFKVSCLIMLISFIVIPNIPVVENLQKAISTVNNITEVKEDNTYEETSISYKVIKVIFSGRENFLMNTAKIYNNSNIYDKMFGIGFTNRSSINDKHIEKLIEIDPLDIFFHYGIFIFAIYFIPLLYILIKFFVAVIKKKIDISYFKLTNIAMIGITTMISFIAGHVFSSPAVSIYIAITIAMLFNTISSSSKTKDDKKITIFALHLGYGGVEKYIYSLCEMLKDNYEIEIISTYKVLEKPAFPISDKVKITYLINDSPNREEFKEAIGNKNIIKIFKEGIKAVKLLYLKRSRNIKAIRNTYSKYIITTRKFHNRLVGYYAYKDIIKIATEHNYHNNDKKYIKSTINSIKGFDYFVVVSLVLQKFYQDKTQVKVIYIPNVIDNLPNKRSDLLENNIINIGRFEKEKDQEELIYIVKEIKKVYKDIKLYLIGDGSLKGKLMQLVKENGIEKNVIFTGFISKEEIEKYLIKSKLFVMTSYTESFGLVLIEAMSYGVACIAYDSADGAKNLLKNDVGILIQDRNREEMIKEIIKLLKNKSLLQKYADNGYDECQKYLSKNVREMWYEILK